MMRKHILFSLLVTILFVMSFSQDFFSIDTREIPVGDIVTIFRELEDSQRLSLKEDQEIDSVAVLREELNDGRYSAQILPLGEGNFKIPPIDFTYFDGEYTKEISSSTFEVNLLPRVEESKGTKEVELRADNPIKMIKDKWNPYFLALAGIITVIIILLLIYLIRRKGRETVFGKKNDPAHIVALRMLEELSLKDYLENDKQKAFCVELSFILKTYIENRFGYDIVEMTTDEVSILFSSSSDDIPDKRRIVENLRKMDLVKFARYRLGNEVLTEIFDFTKGFVKKTEVKDDETG